MTSDLRPYPEYKDSGSSWLGCIPAHWDVMRCKYLFREVDGRSKTGEETHFSMSQKHGLIPSKELDGRRLHSESYVGGKLCQANDLVLNRLKAHLGVFAHAKQPGLVSPDYTVLRPVYGDSVIYFELVFKTPSCVAELRCSTRGIVEGFWRLYTDDFYNIRVPVPPASERSSILGFVRSLDAEVRRFIRNRRRLIDVLNEQKQAIINRAVTRGLDPNVPLKPSGIDWLGDIPKHWDVMALRYLATKFGSGVTPRGGATVYQESGVPFLRSQNIHFDGLRLDRVARISTELHASLAATHVRPHDVLLNITGASIGRVCPVPEGFANGNVNQHVCIIRPKCDRIAPGFLAAYLSTGFMQREIYIEQNGASREGLALDAIRAFKIILPPPDEQVHILDSIKSATLGLVTACAKAEREISLIREYRTRLIADVVTGKVDVRGLAPSEPPPVDEPIDEGINDEEMLENDEPDLVEETADGE